MRDPNPHTTRRYPERMGELIVVIALGVVPALVFAGLVRWARARAVAGGPRSLIVQYSPPPGSVLWHGLLLRADRRVFAAMLVDLAVRRQLALHAEEAPGGRRAVASLTVSPHAEVTNDERAVLQAVLGGGEIRAGEPQAIRRDRGTVGPALKKVLDGADLALAAAGLAAKGRRVAPSVLLAVAGLAGLIITLLLTIATIADGAGWILISLSILSLVVTLTALLFIPAYWRKLLPAADPVREHLDGLRQYMALAEADRMRVLQSVSGALTPAGVFHLHERLLPYAVLFGMEKEWAAELKARADGLADDIGSGVGAVGDVIQATVAVGEVVDVVGAVVEVTSGLAGAVSVLGRAALLVAALFN